MSHRERKPRKGWKLSRPFLGKITSEEREIRIPGISKYFAKISFTFSEHRGYYYKQPYQAVVYGVHPKDGNVVLTHHDFKSEKGAERWATKTLKQMASGEWWKQ